MRVGVDQRRDVGLEPLRLTDAERLDRAAHPLVELLDPGLVDEDARRRRALLAGEAECSGHQRRDGVVEVGVGVDVGAVLAPELGQDPLEVALPGCEPGGALDDPGADRERAGEGDRVDERVLDERRPGLPFALGDRKRRGGDAGREQDRRPAARRNPATARPASSRPRCRRRGRPAVIPQRIASGKFQGAITATTPSGA